MEWTIYWITRADDFKVLLSSVSVALTFFTIIAGLAENAYGQTISQKSLGICCIATLVTIFCAVLTPTKQDLMLIYGVPALMRSQAGAIKQAEVLPEKLLKVLNAEADKLLEKETAEK